MQARLIHRFILRSLAMATGILLYGCSAPSDSSRINTRPTSTTSADSSAHVGRPAEQNRSSDVEDHPPPVLVDARPAALIDGKSLTWSELRPALGELAGGQALQEAILDRKVNDAITRAGITISAADVAAERRLLLESLSDDPDQAIRLLDELRGRQHLGKFRFNALMKRNAALRALVRPNVNVTEDAVRNMHELLHGPKRQARLMVLPSLEAAQAAINLVNSGISFIDVAVEMSTDSSAPRGGLLEPISRVDPAYPESIRQTLWSLSPGEISGPVLIDDRYAVVMLVKRIAADGVRFEEAKPALERTVRVQQERLLMDQLARSLVSNVQVTVFDDALHDAWTRQRR